MTDQKPPRLEGGEWGTLFALLRYQRDSLVRKVTDIDDVLEETARHAGRADIRELIDGHTGR